MMFEPRQPAMSSTMMQFEGIHCVIAVKRPADGIMLVTLEGHDIGELGDGPFREMEKDFVPGRLLRLFIDARRGKTASIDVSGEWARWLGEHGDRFLQISMLTGSRFIQMSANLVRRFAGLGAKMLLYSEPAAFDAALADAIVRSRAPRIFEGAHCVITVARPAAGVLLVNFDGHDIGEHGDGLFRELERDLAGEVRFVDLFIDARNGQGASVHVSGAWAKWLGANQRHFRQIAMLTGSRFIEISASFVREFSGLGELMRIYSNVEAFEEALKMASAPDRLVLAMDAGTCHE
jgi:hypothetical protein